MGILRQMLLIVPLAALPAAAHAGVVIEMETHDIQSKSTTTMKTSVDGKFVRSQIRETSRGNGKPGTVNEMIYRPAASDRGAEMLIVSHDDKTYRVMDEQTFKRLGAMMSGQSAAASPAIAEAMKRLTPEQREAMMGRFQQGGMPGVPTPSKPEIRATGGTDKVGGISCKIWEKRVDGVKTEEVCAASTSAFPHGSEVMPTFLDMSAFMKRMFESIPMARRMANDSMAMIREIDGFPVRVRSFDNGALESETVFKGAREQDLAERYFEAPGGYQRKDMMSGR